MEEEKPSRHYKIEVGDIITVRRQNVREHVFYKTSFRKTNFDGTISWYDKNLFFPKGTDIPDNTKIIVKDFFEDARPIKDNRFVTNWTLFIKDWEVVADEKAAFSEYNKAKSEFDINNLDQNTPPF